MVPIRLYEKENCQQCVAASKFLAARGALVETDQITDAVIDAARAQGVTSAPIIQFGELTVGGFDPGALLGIIEAQKAGK